MMCLNPMVLSQRGMPDMVVPCGMCRWCRVMRANLWAMRMMHEAEDHDENVFITLTYDDDHLPVSRSLDPEELTRFWKRLRKELGERRIKYYACGEYGEERGRPHYHAIVFGLGFGDRRIIARAWPFGFNKVQRVNLKTCRYVAKYINKAPLGGSRNEFEKSGRRAPFQVCSRGIGLSWVMARAEDVGKRGIWKKGRQVSMPRYYLKKLRDGGFLQDDVLQVPAMLAMQKSREEHERQLSEGLDMGSEALNERYQERQAIRAEQVKALDSLHGGFDQDGQ